MNATSGSRRARWMTLGDEAISEERLEMMEVAYSGLDEKLYHSLRGSGISHSDTMEAHALGADLESYCFLRSAYDHQCAVVEAGATGTAVHQQAIHLGVTADELAELRSSYRSMVTQYWRSMASSAVADEVPRPTPPMTSDYLAARQAGIGHAGALDFASRLAVYSSRRAGERISPVEVDMWARCRTAGLRSHLVAVARPSLDLRQLGILHAALFALVSHDQLENFDHVELMWMASRSRRRDIDVRKYVDMRLRGIPRFVAVRAARSTKK